jgi:hypothetical protein
MKKTNGTTIKLSFRDEAIQLLDLAAQHLERSGKPLANGKPLAIHIRQFISVRSRRGRPPVFKVCPGHGCKVGPMDSKTWARHIQTCGFLKSAAIVASDTARTRIA